MKKLRAFLARHYDLLAYLFFGGLTTLVNYAVYLPCYNFLNLSASISNIIAWFAAVAFAFLTNKPFVFHSHNWSARVVLPELVNFVGCRAGSCLLETGILWITVDCLQWNGNYMKLLTSIFVVILNYFASKFLVFWKKRSK